jgi:hypothetical protein
MNFRHRPDVDDRPDDVDFADDLLSMKSMRWTMWTMSPPKGGATERAPGATRAGAMPHKPDGGTMSNRAPPGELANVRKQIKALKQSAKKFCAPS